MQKRVCIRDSKHVEEETATAEYVKDADATCTSAEKGHYQATFTNSAFEVQNTATNSVAIGMPKGHEYNTTTINPTCIEKGYILHACGCGDSYKTDFVNALGHDYETSTIAPTCTTQGYTIYTCHCGYSYNDDFVFALGHDYTSLKTVAPTCTEEGYILHACICGDSYTTDNVDALGHIEVIDNEIEPTCTQTGLTEGKHCSRCEEVLIAQQTADALGHNFVDYKCSTCGEWDYTPIEYFTVSAYNDVYSISAKQDVEYPEIVVLPNIYEGHQITVVSDFREVRSISKIIVTDGYTTISGNAFNYNGWLTSIEISATVNDIGGSNNCFFGTTGLEEIIVDEDNQTFKSIDGVLYSKDGKTLIYYPASKVGTLFTVPEHVTVLERNCFRRSKLEKVVLHDGITEIRKGAFIYSSKLKEVNIPNGIITICEMAFDNCESLESIVIPDSVEVIEYNAFSYCDLLKTVKMGNNVTTIMNYAFKGCSSLESITLSKRLTTIGDGVFSDCDSLTWIYIPESVTKMGGYVFSGCENLSIACETMLQPSGWYSTWNIISGFNTTCPVQWGVQARWY